MIPFLDLRAQYRSIQAEIQAAVESVLTSGQFVLGDEVARFEEEFAGHCQARYGAGVNSGTSALHLALLAAGIGPGDEVITTPFTFVATVAAIRYAGARPVFVDIEPETYTLDVAQIESRITARTRAILPVHLFGQPADMDPIMEIARRRGLRVIEDAAQAHGAEYRGRRVGSIGDMGCFSFYPSKNLGAYGEAGMVVTSDPDCAALISRLRNWGEDGKYNHVLKAYNYRMEAMQGAILRVKLRHLEAWTETRRARAALYSRLLAGVGIDAEGNARRAPRLPRVHDSLPRRDMLRAALSEKGIQTGIVYPVPIHLMKAHADLGYKPGDFPEAERAAGEVLALPIYAELSEAQVRTVVDAVTFGCDDVHDALGGVAVPLLGNRRRPRPAR